MLSKKDETGFEKSLTFLMRRPQPTCLTTVEAGSLNCSIFTASLILERTSLRLLKKNRIRNNNVFRIAVKQSVFEIQFSIGT